MKSYKETVAEILLETQAGEAWEKAEAMLLNDSEIFLSVPGSDLCSTIRHIDHQENWWSWVDVLEQES